MKTLILTCLTLVTAASYGVSSDFGRLIVPPPDSVRAQEVRIWIPVQKQQCAVKVTILDVDNAVIRHLVDEWIPAGYYNIYWDKRDDSGRFVPEGAYRYALIACDRREIKTLKASYVPGEREASILPLDTASNPSVTYVLFDTLKVTLMIQNSRGDTILTPLKDSLLIPGAYVYTWTPGPDVPPNWYTFRLRVKEFDHTAEVRYVTTSPSVQSKGKAGDKN